MPAGERRAAASWGCRAGSERRSPTPTTNRAPAGRRVDCPTRAPAAFAFRPSSACAASLLGEGLRFVALRRERAKGPGGVRAGSLTSPDGAIVLAPHLMSILGKLEEYITDSVRGTKGRLSLGHAEVAPRQTTRDPAPAKRFSRARGTLRGFSF